MIFGILGYTRREAKAIMGQFGHVLGELIGGVFFFSALLFSLNIAIAMGRFF